MSYPSEHVNRYSTEKKKLKPTIFQVLVGLLGGFRGALGIF